MSTTDHTHSSPTQLSLLPTPEVPVQFRLDAATCQRGRRHAAAIRQMLEERRLAREAEERAARRPRPPGRAA